MNTYDSTQPAMDQPCAPAAEVQTIRTMFGTPRPAISRVLKGSTAEEVLSNPRIAIIDDEPINIKVVQKYLQLEGYQRFFTTTDSRHAMELIRKETPDAVLLDIMMPHVSGLEILEDIRNSEELLDIPVIILTAANDTETRLEALRLGATEFLGKPVDSIELQVRLRNVLTAKAHRDHLKNYAWELELEVAVRSTELAETHQEVIQCLAKIGEFRDNETGNHVIRVGRYAEIIARQLGLPHDHTEQIGQASALHDIGKVCIPDSILLKPGKLDKAEHDVMKGHCKHGKNTCSMSPGDEPAEFRSHTTAGMMIAEVGKSPLLKAAAVIAYTHHEKWDGSGYPSGLSGEDIPIEGRITAVADVFDALTSERPYKPAFSLDKSLDIIKDSSGSHFDPAVVDAFFAGLGEIKKVYAEYSDVPAGAVAN